MAFDSYDAKTLVKLMNACPLQGATLKNNEVGHVISATRETILSMYQKNHAMPTHRETVNMLMGITPEMEIEFKYQCEDSVWLVAEPTENTSYHILANIPRSLYNRFLFAHDGNWNTIHNYRLSSDISIGDFDWSDDISTIEDLTVYQRYNDCRLWSEALGKAVTDHLEEAEEAAQNM